MHIRRARDRGHTRLSWLDSRHSFSFAAYYDPDFTGFGDLRVINDDEVAPGGGFATHPHRDMEIITYVLDGALKHRDSLGNGSVIRPGDVQRMSAGTGITHSEYNHSSEEPVRFLQIWILPERRGVAPGYEQKTFALEEKRGRFRLVASRDGYDGSVTLNQDANMFVALIDGQEEAELEVEAGRQAWIHLARGAATLNGERLAAGDGAAVRSPGPLRFHDAMGAEVLVFDLAGKDGSRRGWR